MAADHGRARRDGARGADVTPASERRAIRLALARWAWRSSDEADLARCWLGLGMLASYILGRLTRSWLGLLALLFIVLVLVLVAGVRIALRDELLSRLSRRPLP
jgi:hypothetical protein